jgi:hypothetical protein
MTREEHEGGHHDIARDIDRNHGAAELAASAASHLVKAEMTAFLEWWCI